MLKTEKDEIARKLTAKLEEAAQIKAAAEAALRAEVERKLAAEQRSAKFAEPPWAREPDELDRELEADARRWAQEQHERLLAEAAEMRESAERARRKCVQSAALAWGWGAPQE